MPNSQRYALYLYLSNNEEDISKIIAKFHHCLESINAQDTIKEKSRLKIIKELSHKPWFSNLYIFATP